jgi:hypothetical protein
MSMTPSISPDAPITRTRGRSRKSPFFRIFTRDYRNHPGEDHRSQHREWSPPPFLSAKCQEFDRNPLAVARVTDL